MKIIIYILLVISIISCPRQSFATVGHHAPVTSQTTRQTVITTGVQKSKFVSKRDISTSSAVISFFAVAILSVLSLIIGLILLNWWLIILGAIGVSLFLGFIYMLSHLTFR